MQRPPGSAFAAFAVAGFATLATLAGPAAPLHATGTQVGVLPANGCPGGSTPYNIYIDNEDRRNANSRTGFIGSILSTENTHFYVCKMDGAQFKHVPGNPYMVFSLGSMCPNGSQTVYRTFDADNGNPGSWSDIYASTEGLPINVIWPWTGPVNNDQRKDVSITFCLFDGNTSNSNNFGPMPQFGWDYGVFAAPSVSFAIATGYLTTDDEDTGYWNRWCEDSSSFRNRTSWNCTNAAHTYRSYGNLAMDGDFNTALQIVKVKGTIRGDGACRGTETCATAPEDCGACPTCNNGICEVNEYCPQDCGYCGDYMCQGSETCSTCCGDCGSCPGDPWSCNQP